MQNVHDHDAVETRAESVSLPKTATPEATYVVSVVVVAMSSVTVMLVTSSIHSP